MMEVQCGKRDESQILIKPTTIHSSVARDPTKLAKRTIFRFHRDPNSATSRNLSNLLRNLI